MEIINPTEVPTGLSAIESLRMRAREAVIEANVDPSKLTPEEHHKVDLLQAMASRVVAEANEAIFAPRQELS